MIKVKPFLRWAGGKTWLTKHIEDFLPASFENYYEPFVGGGSMFLFLKSNGFIKNRAYLSDTNVELVNAYKVIKRYPLELIKILENYRNNEQDYYRIRNSIFDNNLENAARFIYLNKTSFNGIYRVNKKGEYNVPFGYRKTKDLFEFDNLINVAELLKNTFLTVRDFKDSCKKIEQNDLIFLDPPYTVAHENNGFIQYNQKIFSLNDQIELSKLIEQIKEKGANYILTNAKHNAILDIYKNIDSPKTFTRSSTVGGTGARRKGFNEYIFSNKC